MSDPSTTPVMLTDRHREALSSAQAQVNRVVLGKHQPHEAGGGGEGMMIELEHQGPGSPVAPTS